MRIRDLNGVFLVHPAGREQPVFPREAIALHPSFAQHELAVQVEMGQPPGARIEGQKVVDAGVRAIGHRGHPLEPGFTQDARERPRIVRTDQNVEIGGTGQARAEVLITLPVAIRMPWRFSRSNIARTTLSVAGRPATSGGADIRRS